jgi:hypothetical protein
MRYLGDSLDRDESSEEASTISGERARLYWSHPHYQTLHPNNRCPLRLSRVVGKGPAQLPSHPMEECVPIMVFKL